MKKAKYLIKMRYCFLIIYLIGLISCSKHEIGKEPDKIFYVDIKDTLITSIDSTSIYEITDLRLCHINYPSDSTVVFNLDVNNDGYADFEIRHSHNYGYGSYFSPHLCLYENYRISVIGLKNNKICVDSSICPIIIPKQIAEGDIIGDKTSEWSEYCPLLVRGPLYSSFCQYTSGSDIVGFEILKDNSTFYGWLKVDFSNEAFIVKEYCINYTNGNPIVAGQKF